MKDKELKLEETEAAHTLGGAGEGRVQVRGKWRGCRPCVRVSELFRTEFIDTTINRKPVTDTSGTHLDSPLEKILPFSKQSEQLYSDYAWDI
jgi:hypothetical protein